MPDSVDRPAPLSTTTSPSDTRSASIRSRSAPPPGGRLSATCVTPPSCTTGTGGRDGAPGPPRAGLSAAGSPAGARPGPDASTRPSSPLTFRWSGFWCVLAAGGGADGSGGRAAASAARGARPGAEDEDQPGRQGRQARDGAGQGDDGLQQPDLRGALVGAVAQGLARLGRHAQVQV